MPESTVWRRTPHVAYVDGPDRAVVLDLDHLDHPPYVFEGPAARVWSLVDGQRHESAIVSELAGAHETDPDVLAVDVRRFLDRLRDLGLVLADGL